MNQAFHLFRLQQIDTQISQVENQLKEIERLLAGDENVRQAQKNAEEKNKLFQKARQALKEAEFAVREQTVKIDQCESSLYGGKVRNPKELQDLQKEIVSLKKHLNQLEDRQIETMVEAEDAEKAAQTAEAQHQKARAVFIENSAGWSGQKDQLLRNLERLLAERSPALSFIDKDSLDVYNRLRQKKNGIGVTSASDGSCTVCGGTIRPSEVQAARNAQTLAFCSSCGRILYAG